MKNNKSFKKIITLSYDDGRSEDYRLVKLLNKYNLKATFHLNSGKLGKPKYIKETDISELFKGHEVSAHTVTHPRLYFKSKHFLTKQITNDAKELSKLCGYKVRGMSYPWGDYNPRIGRIMASCGMEYARVVKVNKTFDLPKDVMNWKPSCHDSKGMKMAKKFFEDEDAKLLYIWGHSYEHDKFNSWEQFEELCQFIANREDIWYATNIEIIDYMNRTKES